MSDEGQQTVQLWVRTEKAQVFGPLTATSVELLFDNGIIVGRVQVSLDGENYVFPGRMPGVRVIFPRELWGEPVVEGAALDEAWKTVVLPPPLPGSERPAAPAGVPARGPMGPAPTIMQGLPPGAASQARAPRYTVSQPSRPPVVAQAKPLPQVSMTSAALFDDLKRPTAPLPPGSRPLAPLTASPSGVRRPSAVLPAARSVTSGPLPGSSSSGVAAAPLVSTTSALRPAPPPAVSTPSSERATQPSLAPPSAMTLPTAGDLAECPMLRLYARCAASNSTALLTLRLPDRELFVHFRKGSPEFVDSSHAEDTLQAFLLGQGLATPQQIGLADAQKGRFGGELLPALFGLGLINPSSAFQQLSERAAALIFRALSSTSGSFTLHTQELPQNKSMPLGNRWSVYLEQLRRIPTHEVQRQMSSSMDLPVMRGEGLVPVSELRLQPQEARALTFFDGTRSLAQAERDSALEGDVCVRTAWMLSELELVTFAAVSQPAAPRAPAESVAEAPAPAPIVTAAPPPAAPAPAPIVTAAPPPAAPAVPMVAAVAQSSPSQVTPKHAPPMPSGVHAPAPGPPPGAPGRSTVPYPGAKPPQPPVAAPAAAPPQRPATPPQSSASGVNRPTITSGLAAPLSAPPAPAPAVAPVAASPRPVSAPPPLTRPSGVLPPTRPASGAPPARSTSGPVASQAGVDPKQLVAQFEKMKAQNYFDVLGVPRTADSNAVKIGYLKMARVYHPDTVPPGSPDAVVKAMADIFALIGEANRTLTDQKLRADYLAEVEAGTAGEKVDVAHLLAAEELFQRGCILVKARKFAEAVKVLDEAIQMNDREGEYLGWRGYARYFTFHDRVKGLQESLKEVNQSLRINPNAAPVHYFQGFLYKTAGDLVKAKGAFQKCVALDSRHVDAQRELRMMK
jgi:hypothetical protein